MQGEFERASEEEFTKVVYSQLWRIQSLRTHLVMGLMVRTLYWPSPIKTLNEQQIFGLDAR